ncbi:MAG: hypothetical protein NT051_01640, partial [Candidatus Micrarchaeota archaeon]|nr:hypothetical protein [Candidatus Micrarchaeota archaeon]
MGSNIYQEAAQKTLKEKMPEALRGAVPEALKRINTRPEYGLYDASISKKGALSVFMKLHSHKEGLDEKDLSIL